MDIGSLIQNVLGSGVTATAIYGLVLLFTVDFVTGVSKAISGHAFDFAYFDSWVRSRGTRLINIIVVLLAGAAAPSFTVLGFDINPLTTLGVGWAATAAATAIKSITDNVNPADHTVVPAGVANPGAE